MVRRGSDSPIQKRVKGIGSEAASYPDLGEEGCRGDKVVEEAIDSPHSYTAG